MRAPPQPSPPVRSRRRVSTLVWTLACLGLFAGCSDVQGETDAAATLTLDGRGASYLAYQDGLGAWQPLGPGGEVLQKLTLTDLKGRYGVMNLCLVEATGSLTVNVQQGVLGEVPVVSASCPTEADPPAAVVSVSGRLSGLSDGEYSNVYVGGASALVDSSASQHRLELPAARYDLIATKYEQNARVPSRLVFMPGLRIVDGAALDVDFSGPHAATPEAATLPLAGVRPGELLSGSVEVVTEAGTAALLGEYLGGDALTYARPPKGFLLGARLRAEAQSFSYDERTKAGSSRSVTRTFVGGSPLNGAGAPLRLPLPIAVPLLTLGAEDGVRPQARWHALPARGTYAQFYSQIQGRRSVSYRLSQSSAWLLGRPFSYTLPDFSALPEWRSAWELVRGEDIFWDVSFSRRTEDGALFASRSGVLTP